MVENRIEAKDAKPQHTALQFLYLTPEEIRGAIARTEQKMIDVDATVEQLLEDAFNNPFRFERISIAELEADPETADELKELRCQLVISYLETYAERIRILRSMINEQVKLS